MRLKDHWRMRRLRHSRCLSILLRVVLVRSIRTWRTSSTIGKIIIRLFTALRRIDCRRWRKLSLQIHHNSKMLRVTQLVLHKVHRKLTIKLSKWRFWRSYRWANLKSMRLPSHRLRLSRVRPFLNRHRLLRIKALRPYNRTNNPRLPHLKLTLSPPNKISLRHNKTSRKRMMLQ